MKVVMAWHGGASYAPPDCHETKDLEAFDSIADAVRAFRYRADDSYYPCVSEDAPEDGGPEAWLFLATTPAEVAERRDPYPDRILSFGPRGGVCITPA